MSNLIINTESNDQIIAKAKARVEQIEKFTADHMAILNSKSDAISQWAKEAGAKSVEVKNFRSTGGFRDEDTYTEKNSFCAWIELDIPVKTNYELQNSRLSARFKELTGLGISANGYGRSVSFQIWF